MNSLIIESDRARALRELCKQRVSHANDLPGRFWCLPWWRLERLFWRAFYMLKTAVCLVLGWERYVHLSQRWEHPWVYGTVFLDYAESADSEWGTMRNWTCICTGYGMWRNWWYAVVQDGCP